jgi:hypothetical protein
MRNFFQFVIGGRLNIKSNPIYPKYQMSDHLVVFNPKVFFLLNPNEQGRPQNKMELYQYYFQHRGHLLSNLNLHPKYHQAVSKILRLNYYQQNLFPVRNESEMYRDLLERLQYLPLLDCILSHHHRIELVRQFHRRSQVERVNSLNYIAVKSSPELFFQFLARSYLNLSHSQTLREIYEEEYHEDAIATIVHGIHQHLDRLIAIKKGLMLVDVSKPVLVIKCYDRVYLNVVHYLLSLFSDQYQILIEHTFFFDWRPGTVQDSDPLVHRLSLFYHYVPSAIFYLGDLASLKCAIVTDRTNCPGAKQWYYLHHCSQIHIHFLPLLRGLDRLYFRSGQELEELSATGIAKRCALQLKVLPFLLQLSGPSFGPDPGVSTLDPRFTWIYTVGPIQDQEEFLLWCRTVDVPVKFILPKRELAYQTSLNIVYLPLDQILHPNCWRQCQVYLETNSCFHFQLYQAVVHRQLLILPRGSCSFRGKLEGFYYDSLSLESRSKPVTKSSVMAQTFVSALIKPAGSSVYSGTKKSLQAVEPANCSTVSRPSPVQPSMSEEALSADLSLGRPCHRPLYPSISPLLPQIVELLTKNSLESNKRLARMRLSNTAFLNRLDTDK